MRSPYLVCVLILSFIIPAPAAAPPMQVNWEQLRSQVSEHGLVGHIVTVSVSTGKPVVSALRRIENEFLVLAANPNTQKRWATTDRETRVPRAEVTSLKFGRKGRGGMIGGLVGLGVGGASLAAFAASPDGTEAPAVAGVALLIMIPILVVGGFLIGRLHDKPIPQYYLIP